MPCRAPLKAKVVACDDVYLIGKGNHLDADVRVGDVLHLEADGKGQRDEGG